MYQQLTASRLPRRRLSFEGLITGYGTARQAGEEQLLTVATTDGMPVVYTVRQKFVKPRALVNATQVTLLVSGNAYWHVRTRIREHCERM